METVKGTDGFLETSTKERPTSRCVVAELEVVNIALGSRYHQGERITMRMWFAWARSHDEDDKRPLTERRHPEPSTRTTGK